MVELILAVLTVVVSSAICSGTEAALFSVSMIKAKQMVQENRAGSRALLVIQENLNRPIASIVVFNNIANIVGTSVVGFLVTSQFGNKWLGLASGVLTFLIILFAEIIPKNLGEQYCDRVSLVMARPVLAVSNILTPVLWVLEKITAPLNKSGEEFTTNESEIKLLAHLGKTEGIIGEGEGEMIARVFELNDLTAGDLLSPRTVITWLRATDTLDASRDVILASQHSRIIVAGEEIDEIVGFVLKAELLAAMVAGEGDKLVSEFTKEVRFVPRQIKADALLLSFRRTRQHLAVVLDEFGGVAGVVTLEDVLEVLTGEIMDETDRVEDMQEAARKKNRRSTDAFDAFVPDDVEETSQGESEDKTS